MQAVPLTDAPSTSRSPTEIFDIRGFDDAGVIVPTGATAAVVRLVPMNPKVKPIRPASGISMPNVFTCKPENV